MMSILFSLASNPVLVAAMMALLALRVSIGRNVALRTHDVIVMPYEHPVSPDSAARLLARMPKPLHCKAAAPEGTLTVLCLPLDERPDLRPFYDSERATEAANGGFAGNVVKQYGEGDYPIAVFGRDQVTIASLTAIRLWRSDYMIPSVGYSLDVAGNPRSARDPRMAVAEERGAKATLQLFNSWEGNIPEPSPRRMAASVSFSPSPGTQRRHDSGISGGVLADGVVADVVRETWRSPDSVRLVAAVIFRGQPGWQVVQQGQQGQEKRDPVRPDSAQRDLVAHGGLLGGTATPSVNALVAWEPRTRRLSAGGAAFPVPQGDSAVVVLVDRVDGVGGSPNVTAVVIHSPAAADGMPAAIRAGAQEAAKEMMAQTSGWKAMLLANDTIRKFVEGPRR